MWLLGVIILCIVLWISSDDDDDWRPPHAYA